MEDGFDLLLLTGPLFVEVHQPECHKKKSDPDPDK